MTGICPVCRSVQEIVFAPLVDEPDEKRLDWGLLENYVVVEHETPGFPGEWCPGNYECPVAWDKSIDLMV